MTRRPPRYVHDKGDIWKLSAKALDDFRDDITLGGELWIGDYGTLVTENMTELSDIEIGMTDVEIQAANKIKWPERYQGDEE